MTQPTSFDISERNRRVTGQTRPGPTTKKTILAALVLSCVVLFSLYIRVSEYGFYEDDYWGIVPWFKTPPTQLWADTIFFFETWPTGRPLNHVLPRLFSSLGYHLAGVQGIYFLGFLVHTLNAFLIYLLLRRWLGHWSAVLAGFLLVLLPADTARIIPLYTAHIYTSLTFLLIALLVNRTRLWVASYPIATLSLLSYETAFLLFIVFPLFFAGRGRRVFRWLVHLASCGTVLLLVFGIRLKLGDARANSVISGPGELLWRSLSSLWLGPETSLKTLVKAIVEGPHGQTPFAFLFAGLVALLLLALLRLMREVPESPDEVSNRSQCVTVFLAGIASWIFAYALTLTNYPPTQEAGRLTSTHMAAMFGLACAIAGATAYLRALGKPAKIAATTVVTILVGMLTLYSFRVQAGFAVAWEKERKFWRRVIELCPDITPDTRIILVGTEPKQNEFILGNSWADVLVLEDMFDKGLEDMFTTGRIPILFYYDGLAKLADIRFENGQVTWKPVFWSDKREVLNLNDVIILRGNGDTMVRIDEVRLPEIPFPLHTKPVSLLQTPHSPPRLTGFGRFLLRNL
jgi:hypothetical protein